MGLVVILAVGAFYVLFSLLLPRLMTGEWPDLVVPGSHGGTHESDWWRPDERRWVLVRLRKLVRTRVDDLSSPLRPGARETGLAARHARGLTRIPRDFEVT